MSGEERELRGLLSGERFDGERAVRPRVMLRDLLCDAFNLSDLPPRDDDLDESVLFSVLKALRASSRRRGDISPPAVGSRERSDEGKRVSIACGSELGCRVAGASLEAAAPDKNYRPFCSKCETKAQAACS